MIDQIVPGFLAPTPITSAAISIGCNPNIVASNREIDHPVAYPGKIGRESHPGFDFQTDRLYLI
jgi:hypothetical protein